MLWWKRLTSEDSIVSSTWILPDGITKTNEELCCNLGDEADQAALCGFSSMTSIPSWNVAPAMSLGN
ncbi:hypothetical protein [Mesorhizobium huakuii]|uniref:hypothetical protein n=1 Tax=Mesorhizobium huakuii TaxID=28104 RepID=UPI003D78D3EB